MFCLVRTLKCSVFFQIAYAMRMSMADNEAEGSMDVDDEAKEGDNDEDYSEVLQDPAFIQVSIGF